MHIATKYDIGRAGRSEKAEVLRGHPVETQSCSHLDRQFQLQLLHQKKKTIVFSEPAPSTAAPVAADSSSEEEEELLQVLTSTEYDDEITRVAAALARSSLRTSQSKLVVRATKESRRNWSRRLQMS
jgi:hypothetical protein